MTTRREIIKSGIGLAGIIAAGKAPAVITRGLLGAHGMDFIEDDNGLPDNPTAIDYIHDGLVAMWDGIENIEYGYHDDNPTEWVSLINAQDSFKFSSIEQSNLVAPVYHVEDDHLHIDKLALWRSKTKPYSYKSSYGTLEVVMSFWGTNESYQFSRIMIVKPHAATAPGVNLQWVDIDGNGRWVMSPFYSQAKQAIDITNIIGKKCTVSLQAKNATSSHVSNYINSEEAILTTFDSNVRGWEYGYIGEQGVIGGWKGGSVLETGYIVNTDLYCIRYYNRDLTPKEIRYNYLIDQMRFGLPTT